MHKKSAKQPTYADKSCLFVNRDKSRDLHCKSNNQRCSFTQHCIGNFAVLLRQFFGTENF